MLAKGYRSIDAFCTVPTNLADLPVDHKQWNALVAETAGATVFQTYEWFECWWKAFGSRHELFLVTLLDNDSLVGIAPLMLVRRIRLRQLELSCPEL